MAYFQFRIISEVPIICLCSGYLIKSGVFEILVQAMLMRIIYVVSTIERYFEREHTLFKLFLFELRCQANHGPSDVGHQEFSKQSQFFLKKSQIFASYSEIQLKSIKFTLETS